jgi:MFS family permease
VNVSNAAVFGLQKDLKLTTLQYSNCLVIFFVPYVIFEIPSNIFLRRFKPSTWLSICMFGFGFTTIMQGLVKGYSGFLATRFFLGLFEVNQALLPDSLRF